MLAIFCFTGYLGAAGVCFGPLPVEEIHQKWPSAQVFTQEYEHYDNLLRSISEGQKMGILKTPTEMQK